MNNFDCVLSKKIGAKQMPRTNFFVSAIVSMTVAANHFTGIFSIRF